MKRTQATEKAAKPAPKSFSRRSFLKGTAGAVALLGAPAFIKNAGPSTLRKVRFQLAWIPSGQYTYAFTAQEMGFWKGLGLDVEIHRGFGSGSTSNNVATGQYEVGEASFGTAVLTASKGGPLVAMGARYQKSPIGFAALKKKGVKKPKDLEGMKVADSAGSGAYVLLPAFAKATGIDLSKVKIEFVSPAAYLPSLLAGKVDAVSTYYVSIGPPLLARRFAFDFLFHADYGLDMLDQVFITQPKRLKEDKELFRNFVEGALKGVAFSYLTPEKAVDITMKKLPLYGAGKESKRLIEVGQGVATAMGVSPHVEKQGLGWMEPSLVKDSVDKVATYMGAAKIADVESLYTNEFIGKVRLTAEQWAQVKAASQKYLPS